MSQNYTLTDDGIKELISSGKIILPEGLDPEKIIQPSSMDLPIGEKVWAMKGSARPKKGEMIENLIGMFGLRELDLTKKESNLYTDRVYLAKTVIGFDFKNENIRIRTNPKSSTGRIDVQTRMLFDKCDMFDECTFPFTGSPWVEIIPNSFVPVVNPGAAFSQARFSFGDPKMSDDEIYHKLAEHPFLNTKDRIPIPREEIRLKQGVILTLDLNGENCPDGIIGYKSVKSPLGISMKDIGAHQWKTFFEPIYAPKTGHLLLEPGTFYILSTNEAVSLPLNVAGELAQYDSTIGHITSHYAGFVDPGYGLFPGNNGQGNTITLEVRIHNQPEMVRDKQPIAKLVLERMSGQVGIKYGMDKGSNYADQIGPKLGKFFS